jgi:hypothetical protein
MKLAVCLIACALPLAACNKSPEVHATNASVGEVASKVEAAAAGQEFVRPGEWESTTTMEEMSMSGMPPQVQAQMKRAMAAKQAHTFKSCITEADVKRPKEDFFSGKNNQCRYEHFNMGGGKIDAAMHCATGEGQQMTMNVSGTYAPESYDVNMQMSGQGGEAGHNMTMKSHTVSHRVGECTSEELAKRKNQ